MKRFALLLLLLLPLARPATAQQTPAELLRLGVDAYQRSETEKAKNFFAQIIASRQQVTPEQRITAYKYLGAYWALQSSPGALDSAFSFFLPAIELDPFSTLDPNVFAADELAAFGRARSSIFKVGIQPIEPKALDPSVPDSARYTFRVISTRPARLTATIVSLADPNKQEPLGTLGGGTSVNDIVWNGLINNSRADSGLYEFRLEAEDNAGRGRLTERQRFKVEHVLAKLEDTLPDFKESDLLRSDRPMTTPYFQGARGAFVASLAAALPVIAFSQRDKMSQWQSHLGIGIAIGAVAGTGAAVYANKNMADARALAENARRRQERAAYNAGVIARNKARRDKTILVIRPLSAGITG